jgi:hypothetical protein
MSQHPDHTSVCTCLGVFIHICHYKPHGGYVYVRQYLNKVNISVCACLGVFTHVCHYKPHGGYVYVRQYLNKVNTMFVHV